MVEVSSYRELMAEQARAAIAISGADHTSWNGDVEPLPAPEGKTRGRARWHGTIEYHRIHVIRALEEMFDNAGQIQNDQKLQEYRDALGVVLHENVHLLAARGTSHGFGSDAYQEEAVQVLEEGVTEAYKQDLLNAYIDELGLEKIAPGIRRVRTVEDVYPAFVPAAKEFAGALERRAKLPDGEVLRRLAVVNAEDKFPVAAQIMYAAADLEEFVPQSARGAAIEQIVTAMKRPFADVHGYDPFDPQDVKMAALAGTTADRLAYKEARAIATHWLGIQDLRQTMDVGLSGTRTPKSPRKPSGPANPSANRRSTRHPRNQRPERNT